MAKIKTNSTSKMEELLAGSHSRSIPKIGDLVEGKIIFIGKNEVYVDIDGLTTGVVRGKEVHDESGEYAHLKLGDTVKATLLDLENELGAMELSFRFAGHQKAWGSLHETVKKNMAVLAMIMDANKGGLMVKLGGVTGFLPVSQLTPEHYPRVEGGDKGKILEKLKDLIGKELEVKVLDANERDGKLIVSEKAAWEEKQQSNLASYKVGDIIDGRISGLVDFGAFIEFGNGLEGLAHISELAWQRLDRPHDIYRTGQTVQAKIIEIEGAKISLSIKQTKDDPWKTAAEKYQIGQKVKGKVLKVNPFGLFVELDPEIHGLAHISELSNKKIKSADEAAKPGDELEFTIISLEPEHHRLGLSLKPKVKKKEEKTDVDKEPEKEEEKKEKKTKKKEVKEEKEA
ncbi:MAG: S1 RNA-binding domain-containing protein [bacterium]